MKFAILVDCCWAVTPHAIGTLIKIPANLIVGDHTVGNICFEGGVDKHVYVAESFDWRDSRDEYLEVCLISEIIRAEWIMGKGARLGASEVGMLGPDWELLIR